jgi:site-specific DNA-adenine methylase
MKFIQQEGGKGRFIDAARQLQPWDWDIMVEPFAGSAAVTFAFKVIFPHKSYVLGDINAEIANAFIQLRDDQHGVRQWAMHYEAFLHDEKTARTVWEVAMDAASNPSRYTPSQRAALSYHAGHLGKRWSTFSPTNRSFSPTQAGFRKNVRWRRNASAGIDSFDHWHRLLQDMDIQHADYRELLLPFGRKQPFVFLDPPYRLTTEGRPTDELYYGVQFDLIEFGQVCSRLAQAGSRVLVTLDAHEENLDLFGPEWIALKATWRSYATKVSHHLVFLNYEPLMPVDEIAAIQGWEVITRPAAIAA